MVSRAINLVEHEFHASARTEKILGKKLQQFVGLNGALPELAQLLSKRIRSGDFDLSEELYEFMRLVVAFKLKETNPLKVGEELEDSLDQLLIKQTTTTGNVVP